MGLIATITEWIAGASSREVSADPGHGASGTNQASFPPGFDAQGFADDLAVFVDIQGGRVAVGYLDPQISREAGPGEVIIFSRSGPGQQAAKIWLKADGTIDLNGVEISPQGKVTAPDDVVAMAGTPATQVTLSGHKHVTGVGPTQSPTPGT